jgi:hypothetical protein
LWIAKSSLHLHLGLHLGADDKTYTGYSIKHLRNHDFANMQKKTAAPQKGLEGTAVKYAGLSTPQR